MVHVLAIEVARYSGWQVVDRPVDCIYSTKQAACAIGFYKVLAVPAQLGAHLLGVHVHISLNLAKHLSLPNQYKYILI